MDINKVYNQLTKIILTTILCLSGSFTLLLATENSSSESVLNTSTPGAVYFTPPAGWRQADSTTISPTIKILVVGKGKKDFPPSINLAVEPYKGTLNDYLKLVKKINLSKGGSWKDLGKIQTEAGEGSLSQLDTKTAWGNTRMLHTIVLRDNTIYIMTAAALQEEFSSYYKSFFDSMRSLHIND